MRTFIPISLVDLRFEYSFIGSEANGSTARSFDLWQRGMPQYDSRTFAEWTATAMIRAHSLREEAMSARLAGLCAAIVVCPMMLNSNAVLGYCSCYIRQADRTCSLADCACLSMS
jgi:hypothetical protein